MNDAKKFMDNWLETPESREEWIDKKAREGHDEMLGMDNHCHYKCGQMARLKDFIRSIVEEIHGRKQN